ncbi:MAG: hypothetical protein EOO01_30710 [Chitinophagaceae bacterium]|nr:MAG: hypothetical protein EOO01_30710 [Chitinophagaceae bacterium]
MKQYTLIPIIGFILFIILYVVAASLYPGGSEIDRFARGFSLRHNYWCDLLQYKSENGQTSPSRPVAILALGILSLSLALFWLIMPPRLTKKVLTKRTIQSTGMVSMLILFFLQAESHDIILNIASITGCIAIASMIYLLFRAGLYVLFSMGVVGILLLALNIYIYYSKTGIYYLPLIQKFSFALLLLWFTLICLRKYPKIQD